MTNQPPRPAPKSVRLLPAVIGIGALVLVLKAAGLAFTASASEPATQTATTQKATDKTAAPAKTNSADPTAAIKAAMPVGTGAAQKTADTTAETASNDTLPPDLAGAGISPAEMDVLNSLSARRDTLDQRDQELTQRANLIAVAEGRVNQKIAELKAIQEKIQALLGQRDEKENAQLDMLVKVYSAMKPADAARIFASLDDDIRTSVASRMKPDTLAQIVGKMPSDAAQKLTMKLAGRYKLPEAETQAAQAAAAPLAQTPTDMPAQSTAPQTGAAAKADASAALTPQANAAAPAPQANAATPQVLASAATPAASASAAAKPAAVKPAAAKPAEAKPTAKNDAAPDSKKTGSGQ